MILDLHGAKHEEVTRQLDVFLWENIKKLETQVRVITGNSPTMKNIVKDCVVEYGLKCREEMINSGTLIVDLI
jgi:DNA-nicking Smr family endonuclease